MPIVLLSTCPKDDNKYITIIGISKVTMEQPPFTIQNWREMSLAVLNELPLSKRERLKIMDKLLYYKYVDEISDLKYGAYVRWINIENPAGPFPLTKGALFCETKITDDGVFCICKNIGYVPTFFQISLEKNLIFQKFTKEEIILLYAMEHAFTT